VRITYFGHGYFPERASDPIIAGMELFGAIFVYL
jgi:hypothetical protein